MAVSDIRTSHNIEEQDEYQWTKRSKVTIHTNLLIIVMVAVATITLVKFHNRIECEQWQADVQRLNSSLSLSRAANTSLHQELVKVQSVRQFRLAVDVDTHGSRQGAHLRSVEQRLIKDARKANATMLMQQKKLAAKIQHKPKFCR